MRERASERARERERGGGGGGCELWSFTYFKGQGKKSMFPNRSDRSAHKLGDMQIQTLLATSSLLDRHLVWGRL